MLLIALSALSSFEAVSSFFSSWFALFFFLVCCLYVLGLLLITVPFSLSVTVGFPFDCLFVPVVFG